MLFKVESLQALKYMVKERDNICKIDLKDAYFAVPLDKSRRNLVRFYGKGISTNSCVYVLVSEQPLEFLPKL